jgi:hypothetical protein
MFQSWIEASQVSPDAPARDVNSLHPVHCTCPKYNAREFRVNTDLTDVSGDDLLASGGSFTDSQGPCRPNLTDSGAGVH